MSLPFYATILRDILLAYMKHCVWGEGRYLYTDEIEVTINNIFSVMYVAKKYLLTTLEDKCMQFINADNVCAILEISQKMGGADPGISDQCLDFISQATFTVLQTQAFRKLSKNTLRLILGLHSLSVGERDVFCACWEWARSRCQQQEVEANARNIRRVLHGVLPLIRIPSMTLDEYTSTVVPTNILSAEEEAAVFRYMTCSVGPDTEIPFPVKARTLCPPVPLSVSPEHSSARDDIIPYRCHITYGKLSEKSHAPRHTTTLTFQCDHTIRLFHIRFLKESEGTYPEDATIDVEQNKVIVGKCRVEPNHKGAIFHDDVTVKAGVPFTMTVRHNPEEGREWFNYVRASCENTEINISLLKWEGVHQITRMKFTVAQACKHGIPITKDTNETNELQHGQQVHQYGAATAFGPSAESFLWTATVTPLPVGHQSNSPWKLTLYHGWPSGEYILLTVRKTPRELSFPDMPHLWYTEATHRFK